MTMISLTEEERSLLGACGPIIENGWEVFIPYPWGEIRRERFGYLNLPEHGGRRKVVCVPGAIEGDKYYLFGPLVPMREASKEERHDLRGHPLGGLIW